MDPGRRKLPLVDINDHRLYLLSEKKVSERQLHFHPHQISRDVETIHGAKIWWKWKQGNVWWPHETFGKLGLRNFCIVGSED